MDRVALTGLNPAACGTHSLHRATIALVYQRTGISAASRQEFFAYIGELVTAAGRSVAHTLGAVPDARVAEWFERGFIECGRAGEILDAEREMAEQGARSGRRLWCGSPTFRAGAQVSISHPRVGLAIYLPVYKA